MISRNAYFASPENILLAMLTDERRCIGALGIQRVIKAREIGETVGHVGIRKLHRRLHRINSAPPPILNDVTTQHLKSILEEPIPID